MVVLSTAGLIVVLALAATTAHAQPNQDKFLPDSIVEGVAALRNCIEREVALSGGDLEHQGLHLIVGFSTGNFEKDPLAASAARYVATLLVRNLCVRNDHVTSCAWERGVWYRKSLGITQEGTSDPSSLWPLTSNPGNSMGGHDTENAIVETTQELEDPKDAVILLLTNTAASAGQPGIGANSPQYKQVLDAWRRVTASGPSGASLEIPYRIQLLDKTIQERTIEAVILVPKQFAGSTLERSRSQLRIASTPPVPDQPKPLAAHDPPPPPARVPPTSSRLPKVFFVAAVLALASIASAKLLLRSSGRSSLLKIETQTFTLENVADSADICFIVGQGHEVQNLPTVVVHGPPVRIARVRKCRGGITIECGREVRLETVDGKGVVAKDPWRITDEVPHHLVFRTDYRPDPALPPQRMDVKVIVQLLPPGGT